MKGGAYGKNTGVRAVPGRAREGKKGSGRPEASCGVRAGHAAAAVNASTPSKTRPKGGIHQRSYETTCR